MRERIPYGVGHVFEVALVSTADTTLHKTSPTLAAGDAKVRTHAQGLTNLTAEYVAFTSGSVEPSVGATLTGATSSTTTVVVGVKITSGSWSGGDAAGALFLEQNSGALQSENLDNTTTGDSNVMTIGGDSTAALMASLGGGVVGVPITSAEAATDIGTIELVDVSGAEWCSDGLSFETYGHESSFDPQGCILTDAVGSATGQTTTNIRLSGAPATAPKAGYFFEVTQGTGVGQAGYVKSYTAGATYDVVPYDALGTALDATSTVKFYRDATHVPAIVPDLTDALSEATAVPAATASIADKINYLFSKLVHKVTFNKSTGVVTVYQSDGSTAIGGGTDADDGTTFTKGAES